MLPPNGIAEIVATFGDIHQYVNSVGLLSPTWNALYLDRARLPYPMTLAWPPAHTVTQITCHKLMVPIFEQVFEAIVSQGLQSKASLFGGCFNFRPERTGKKLSTHSWGIALDLNPSTNEQGTKGDMEPGVVKIFTDAGFEWGGLWPMPKRDPMHYQFCSGY